MLKRREFLKSSVVVATVASTGALSAAPTSAAMRIHFVLVDEEFEDSVSFANELIERGARAFSLQEDIGRLWFGELGQAFEPGHAIAGLTSHAELLVSAAFARDRGARVRFEGSHDCRGADVLTHALRIGEDDLPMSGFLTAADAAWPRALASRLGALSMCESLREEQCRTHTQRSSSHPGSLFSWVIA